MTDTSRYCAVCSTPIREAVPEWALTNHPQIADDLAESFARHPDGPYALVLEGGDTIARPLRAGQIPAARRHLRLYRPHECTDQD